MVPLHTPAPRHAQRGLTLIELMVLLCILMLLAAVAGPTFLKHVRRSRTVEAALNVRKLYDGVATYYATDRSDYWGAFQPREFPDSAGHTPVFGACCSQPGGRCAPNPGYWNGSYDGAQTWQQIGFTVNEPFYYVYHVWRQTGDGRQVGDALQVGAFGDLNCDGFPSQFGRMVYVAQDRTAQSAGGLWSWNELE